MSFRVDDPARAQQQARTDAIKQAGANADTFATAAGVSITGVASISEATAQTPYPIYYGAAAGARRPRSRDPDPGRNGDVTITVSVVYLIG